MTVWYVVLLCVGLVLLNGAFVAAEFSLLSAPRTTIERKATGGDKLAHRLLRILESAPQQDRYIATSQIGISAVSLALGMYGEHEVAALIQPVLGDMPPAGAAALATGLALAALTVLHIVFGEMVPKTIALQRPELTGRLAFWPMQILLALLYPVVRLLAAVAGLCLRLVGVRRQANTQEQLHTPEELQLIVEESAEGGALRADAGRLLRELFEFGDLTAGQVMVPRVRVVGLPVGAPADEVRRVLTKHRHTRYPVFDGDLDHIAGMLHVKDLLRRLTTNEPISAADVRTIPVVPETSALDDVLATMERSRAHMAVVIDEHGGTAGLISLEDLFEEVVGELDEGEGAPVAPALAPQPDGSVLAAGTVRLDELGQHFNIDLQHEEVDSLSGLVLARLDRPPVVGDVVAYGRIRLEVTATTGHGVREVRATLLPVESSS